MNASASTGTEKARAHHQYHHHHHHHPHRKLPEPSQAEQLRRFTVKRSDVVCSIGKWQKRCNELHRSAGTPKLPQAQVERIDCTVTHACGSRAEQNSAANAIAFLKPEDPKLVAQDRSHPLSMIALPLTLVLTVPFSPLECLCAD